MSTEVERHRDPVVALEQTGGWADEPFSRAFALIDEMARLRQSTAAVLAGVEGLTGVSLADLAVLTAVDQGVAAPSADIRRVALEGLLWAPSRNAPEPCEPPHVKVTDRGGAVLEQLAALEIRLTTALTADLDADGAQALHQAVTTLAAATEQGARLVGEEVAALPPRQRRGAVER